MLMSDKEIANSYSKSDNKNRQIRILAELNDCDVVSIIQSLNRQGIRLDMRKKAPRARIVKGTGRLYQYDKEIKQRYDEYIAALDVLLLHYTQADLSRLCSIDRRRINSYALHHAIPSTPTFEKMLKGLGLQRNEFFKMGSVYIL